MTGHKKRKLFGFRLRSETTTTKVTTSEHVASGDDVTKTLKDFRHTIEEFEQCPNRIWSIARSLPGGLQNISRLFSSERVLQSLPRAKEKHDKCSYELCELSQQNFTSIEQRHESCLDLHNCRQMKDQFPTCLLDRAADADGITAWRLNGRSLVKFPQNYMAVSHVWSDGTGTGAWPERGVNRCLWFFFVEVAKSLQVTGIWWDTICIPRERAARSKAINRMHCNYEDAAVTVVHDCFIRDFEWDDYDHRVSAEIASLVLIVSPWFSRGWTALELAKSRKVKILFKKGQDYVLKDLDNDILSPFANSSVVHLTAIDVIKSLRHGTITDVNGLLRVLGPRYTSWSRDMAIIAGLLTGIEMLDTDSQQTIYQKVLKKIGKVGHGHLFHNSATMSHQFSWCPANILQMPLSSGEFPLLVEETGTVVGSWKAMQIGRISPHAYSWTGIHPMVEISLRSALKNDTQHVFLVEPDAVKVERALLVRITGKYKRRVCGQLIGFMPYSPPQRVSGGSFILTEVILGESTEHTDVKTIATWDLVRSCRSKRDALVDQPQLNHESVFPLEPGDWSESPLAKGTQSAEKKKDDPGLHLMNAATRGDEQCVRFLLNQKDTMIDFQDDNGWTALHNAVWRGQFAIVKLLVDHKADSAIQDRLGQQPHHLAAERGHLDVLRMLIGYKSTRIQVGYTSNGQTVLHRAAWSGLAAVVDMVGRSFDIIDKMDKYGQTALHIAAQQSCLPVAQLLVNWSVDVNVQDIRGATALSCAARRGDAKLVRLLLDLKVTQINLKDWLGRTPFALAARFGHEHVVRLFLKHPDIDIDTTDIWGRTAVFHAATHGHENVVRILLCVKSKADVMTNCLCRVLKPRDALENNYRALFETFGIDSHTFPPTNDSFDSQYLPMGELEHENPLIRATLLCATEVVEFLLERGLFPGSKEEIPKYRDLDKKIPGERSLTALQLALHRKDEISVRMILDSDEADVNAHERFTLPPLFLAVHFENEALTELLLANEDIDITVLDFCDRSVLVMAAQGGNVAIFKRLLACDNLDVNHRGNQGMTALTAAAKDGNEEMVRLLLLREDIEVDKLGILQSPLSHASEHGHQTVVRLLLETNQVDVNNMSSGSTPLMLASRNGHDTVVELLVDTGNADLSRRGIDGQTPLTCAAEMGHVTTTQLLLNKSRDHPVYNSYQITSSALHYAASRGSIAIMRQLVDVDSETDFDSQDEHLRTPLSYAAERGALAFIKELFVLCLHIDINSQDEFLRTPLSYAAEYGRTDVVAELLSYGDGLDINLEDAMGYTPLFYAYIIGENPRLVAQLISTGKAELGKGCPGDALEFLEEYSEELRVAFPDLFSKPRS